MKEDKLLYIGITAMMSQWCHHDVTVLLWCHDQFKSWNFSLHTLGCHKEIKSLFNLLPTPEMIKSQIISGEVINNFPTYTTAIVPSMDRHWPVKVIQGRMKVTHMVIQTISNSWLLSSWDRHTAVKQRRSSPTIKWLSGKTKMDVRTKYKTLCCRCSLAAIAWESKSAG